TDRGFGGRSGPLVSWISRNFLEFTFKPEYAYDYGMPQWVAKIDHVLSPLPWPAQGLPLQGLVQGRPLAVREGNAARLAHARASVSRTDQGRGHRPRTPGGWPELHDGDSSAALVGIAAQTVCRLMKVLDV